MDSESQEYSAVFQLYARLVDCIKQSPTDLAVQLRPSGVLADTNWEFLTNPQHSNIEKAVRIVDVMLNQIKANPQSFSVLVSALRAAGPWTKAIVGELKPLVLRDAQDESSKLKSIISHSSYTYTHVPFHLDRHVNNTEYVVSQLKIARYYTHKTCMAVHANFAAGCLHTLPLSTENFRALLSHVVYQ